MIQNFRVDLDNNILVKYIMVDVSLNWISTGWNINEASGNFVWADVSGNSNANEDVSGTYILKRVDTGTPVIVIDGSGDYQDFGRDGSFNSINPNDNVTYQTTIKGKELAISYFNHVTVTAGSYEYQLFHKDLSGNEHLLGVPFVLPSINYFEKPRNLICCAPGVVRVANNGRASYGWPWLTIAST